MGINTYTSCRVPFTGLGLRSPPTSSHDSGGPGDGTFASQARYVRVLVSMYCTPSFSTGIYALDLSENRSGAPSICLQHHPLKVPRTSLIFTCKSTIKPVVTGYICISFFSVFAKTSYVRFLLAGNHLGIACFFQDFLFSIHHLFMNSCSM